MPGANIPKLMFTIFNGGKALQSKVRFSKIYLILDIPETESIDVVEVYLKL